MLGLGLVLAVGAAWVLYEDNEDKAARITVLEQEAEDRETAELAAGIARGVASAGRADVEAIVRQALEENARAPTSEACLRDPAVAGAYASMQRMRDAHADALRTAAGRTD